MPGVAADAADGIAIPPATTPPVTAAVATATLNRTMKTPRNAFRAVPPVQDRQAGKGCLPIPPGLARSEGPRPVLIHDRRGGAGGSVPVWTFTRQEPLGVVLPGEVFTFRAGLGK